MKPKVILPILIGAFILKLSLLHIHYAMPIGTDICCQPIVGCSSVTGERLSLSSDMGAKSLRSMFSFIYSAWHGGSQNCYLVPEVPNHGPHTAHIPKWRANQYSLATAIGLYHLPPRGKAMVILRAV